MNKRVLIVDENEILVDFIKTIFQENGFIVDSCCNGAEALSFLNIPKTYELLIVNYNTSDIDGLTLIDKAKTRWPKIKTMLLFGRDAPSPDLYSDIIDCYLVKPFTYEDLREIIYKVLR